MVAGSGDDTRLHHAENDMPSGDKSQGCLNVLLGFLGLRIGPPDDDATSGELPYRLRDDFLSPAERSFYGVLIEAIGDDLVICPKVNLADVFFVARPNENRGARNRIDRKHVDFLVCDVRTMQPVCGVELEDRSHQRRDRAVRDELVDAVFEAAGLALVRFPARSAYRPDEVRAAVDRARKGRSVAVSAPIVRSTDDAPMCPKCGVTMVERVAKKGANRGERFFGCTNYPQCRATAPAGEIEP
jgi:hypothetical protein